MWTEVPDRTIIKAGTAYVGKDYIPDSEGKPTYEVRIFVRKLGSEFEAPVELEEAYSYVRECARRITGIVDIDMKAAWRIIAIYGLDIRSRSTPEAVSQMITNCIDMSTLTVKDGVIVEDKSPSRD